MTRELEVADRMRLISEARVKELMCSYEKEGEFTAILIRVWVNDRKHARTPR